MLLSYGEFASELLPFTLTPTLSKQLENRLRKEKQIQQKESAEALWEERITSARAEIEKDTFWQEVDISDETKDVVVHRLLQVLKEDGPKYQVSNDSLLHHLAQPEQEKTTKLDLYGNFVSP